MTSSSLSCFRPTTVFPASPSLAIPDEDLAVVMGRLPDVWPDPKSLSKYRPCLSAEPESDWDVPFHRRPPQVRYSNAASSLRRTYDAIDTLWRLSQWVDEQGPGACVVWEILDPPCSENPQDGPSGPPYLLIRQTDSRGESQDHGLVNGMSEALAWALQTTHSSYWVSGRFDAQTSLEDRARGFMGPSYARWLKGQRLEKDLPPPSTRSSLGPRF